MGIYFVLSVTPPVIHLWLCSPGHYPLTHLSGLRCNHVDRCWTTKVNCITLLYDLSKTRGLSGIKKKKKRRKFKIDQRKYILCNELSHDISVMGWMLDFLSQSYSSWRPTAIFLTKTMVLEEIKWKLNSTKKKLFDKPGCVTTNLTS